MERDASIESARPVTASRSPVIASRSPVAAKSDGVRTAVLCGLLCATFASLAWAAVRGKSATWDEPSHAAAGWLMWHRHDYRVNPDVPPLWEYWIALPTRADALRFDPASSGYLKISSMHDMFVWCVRVMYQTPGDDGIDLVRRARAMALVLAVALAVLIGRWAWELSGGAAAVAATFIYAFDPNFLGHGPLAKNDVGFTLVYAAAAYAIWRCGRRLSWGTAAAVALLVAAAVGVKPSGLILGPVLAVALVLRALMGAPWPVFGRILSRRLEKLRAAGAMVAVAAGVTYVSLWAMYGFRFDAGPNGMGLDTEQEIFNICKAQILSGRHGGVTREEALAWRPSLPTRFILTLEQHRLVPQAWAHGFVLVQPVNAVRTGFLCGETYAGGRWFYFPAAAAFKTPLATIAAGLMSLAVAAYAWRRAAAASARHAERGGGSGPFETRWAAFSILGPAVFYAAPLLAAPVNIGLRHAFPIYPFVYIGIGLAAGKVWGAGARQARGFRASRGFVCLLAAGLAAESLAAFPDYIAFFNFACGGKYGGLSFLSDSNLDWGQDLPLLAEWQKTHPNKKLYLAYFGLCDPTAYGIRYTNVNNGYLFGPPGEPVHGPAVFAVSATILQQPGIGGAGLLRAGLKPEKILGGTIYLFDVPPDPPAGDHGK